MWKITFFFTQFGVTWTETFYASGTTSYATLVQQANAVAAQRILMNAPQTVLTAVRFVNLQLPRLSSFLTPGTFAGAGAFTFVPQTDPDQDSVPPFVAVQVKFYGVQGHSARRYVSGGPEGIISSKLGGRNIGPLGLWANALTGFVTTLANYGWSFRYTNQTNKQLVTGLLTNAQFPGEIGVSFNQQMIVPVAGQTIQMVLRGFRRVNYRQFGLGGVYSIDPGSPGITASVAPFTYYLQNTSQVSLTNIAVKGYGVQLLYGYDAFSTSGGAGNVGFTVVSANHRKRGVSALALRGRSRSKP